MFFGISHVDVPVTDLSRARRFYEDLLKMKVRRSGEGFVNLENGTIVVRLLLTGRVEHPVSLRIEAPDVEEAFRALVDFGLRPLYPPEKTPALELVGSVLDADGNTVTVWRELSEDEYGFVPALPTEGTWADEAGALLKSLLLAVPSLFRGLARRRVTRIAEELAGKRQVGREDVIRAFILSSAKVTRYRAIAPLKAHGIDPDRYQAEFAE